MYRSIRLYSGLILMAYVLSHLLNHALGIVSLEATERGRDVFLAIWRNPVGTYLVLASLAAHFALVLWSIYQRRRLRLSTGEAIQFVLGIAIPLLLLEHMIGTRGAHEIAGTQDTYTLVLLIHWKLDTSHIFFQITGLLAAWIHGCIGIHYWLRLKPGYDRVLPYLFAGALLVPVLSIIGYVDSGRDVLRLAEDDTWVRATLDYSRVPGKDVIAQLGFMTLTARISVVGLVLATLAARVIRQSVQRWRGTVNITYPGGRIVTATPGATVLEVSRQNGIPHAAVCGGRGRCSTCRVRIMSGDLESVPPSASEQKVLDRIGRPINVRLACQLRPQQDISIIPLLPPTATAREGYGRAAQLSGQERDIAILFADLRSFTKFSESRLPYDVVFVLNRYFANMGRAVEEAGGHLDKFIGDGVMALFGTDSDPAEACRQSLIAAKSMTQRLAELNQTLANELDEPLRMGIGVHVGPAIIGEMGYGAATNMTAIGDAVNTASRLETMTKEFGAQVVVSEDVAERAGVDLSAFPHEEIDVRGKSDKIGVRVIVDGQHLDIA